jgi:hypothetical protein
MSDKLQEWIEVVERAERLCRDVRLDDDATRLAELAAHLRDGGWLPIESLTPEQPSPRAPILVAVILPNGGWQISIATTRYGQFGVGRATHYRPLPAPPAALATPGGED